MSTRWVPGTSASSRRYSRLGSSPSPSRFAVVAAMVNVTESYVVESRNTATSTQTTMRMVLSGIFSRRVATADSVPFVFSSPTRSTPLFCIHRPVGETVPK